jgi:hypothetical protein
MCEVQSRATSRSPPRSPTVQGGLLAGKGRRTQHRLRRGNKRALDETNLVARRRFPFDAVFEGGYCAERRFARAECATSPEGARVRSGLRWTLCATLAASAFSWWWPSSRQGGAAAAVTPVDPPMPSRPPSGEAAPTPRFTDVRLIQADLANDPSRGATFDPFVGVAPPAPPPAPIPVAPPPPAPAQPPPLTYRFFGRVDGVDGTAEIYLTRGNNVVRAQAGLKLDDGYVVEAITPVGVSVAYPPLDAHAVIPLPAETGIDSR